MRPRSLLRTALCCAERRPSAGRPAAGAADGGDAGGRARTHRRRASPPPPSTNSWRASTSDPRVAVLLGVAYYHADDPAHAIEPLAPVAAKLPRTRSSGARPSRCSASRTTWPGHFAEAIPLLEETRACAPDNIELAYVLGHGLHPDAAARQGARASAATFRRRPQTPPPRTCSPRR